MSRLLLCLPFFLSLLALSCGDDAKPAPGSAEPPLDWPAASELNDRAVLLMDQGLIGEAVPLFEELVRRTPSSLYEPRFNLAVALLNSQNNDPKIRFKEMDRSEAILRELCAEAPRRTRGHYTLAILLEHLGRDREEIRRELETCRAQAPLDADCAYRLGKFWFEEGSEHLKTAEPHLLAALELDPQLASAWNTLFGTLRRLGEKERAAEAMRLFQLYSDTRPEVGRKLSLVYNGMGELATCIRRLPRWGPPIAAATPQLVLEVEGDPIAEHALLTGPPVLNPERDALEAARRFAAAFAHPPAIHDLDGDGRIEVFLPFGSEPAGLFSLGDEGFHPVAERWKLPELRGVVGGLFADVDHDGRPDLYVFGAALGNLYLNRESGLLPCPLPEGEPALRVGAQIADLDNDGDLDLAEMNFTKIPDAAELEGDSFPVRPIENRLLSNLRPTIYEGEDATGTAFRSVTAEPFSTTMVGTASLWLDLDRDGDLDLALGESMAGRIISMVNDRMFRFRPGRRGESLAPEKTVGSLIALDIDGDGDPDLVSGSWSAQPTYRWIRTTRTFDLEAWPIPGIERALPWSRPYPADLDNDGDQDLVFVSNTGASLIARNDDGYFDLSEGPRLSGHGLAFHDVNGDGLLDAVFADPVTGRPRVARNRTEGAGRSMTIALRGKRNQGMAATWSTRFGTGASVEVAARGHRVVRDVMTRNGSAAGTGPHLHVGLADRSKADTLRILWPDLVIQTEADDGSRPLVIEEVNRKASSCPVLFKPDGRGGFAFVTDFLGVGGLGFFMKPGEFAPPDRNETVRIGELLPVADHYELRVHEPMEEVSYLDSFHLLAVDHPAGSEVQADERLATAEPMPSGRPLLFTTGFLPLAARSDTGRDCLDELTREDRVYQPDIALDPRFTGYLAREQAIELDFDQAAIAAARPDPGANLWLFLDGFVEYPYSHVNYAAWEAGLRGKAFSLDVRDDEGAWREIAAELGYPGGMTRCMATEVTRAFEAGIGSLRLRSNLDIRVDRVRLAWVLPEDRMTLHRRAFTTAELRFAGYPEERSPDGREPKLYDYRRMSPDFDWKVMAGRYTAFGDVTGLLTEADDAMVIMGHGEEIVLRLPVAALPPVPEGMIRTFFLEAEGYCKDMDPYTAFPETVSPLPHRGLIDYPGALESGPDEDRAPRERLVPGRYR